VDVNAINRLNLRFALREITK